jgi:hypothetical protein
MSRLIFNADTLGGTTTLSSADAVGNFTLTVPAVNGTLSVKDASNDATFRNITLTGAVLAGAWNGSTIAVAYGGTGATTLSGLVFGNGTSAMTAATAAQVVSVIGATFVTNATNATNAVSATTATNIAGGLSGSIPYQTGAGATALLPSGTNGQVLTLTAGLPAWVSVSGTGTVTSVDGSGGTTGLTLTGGPITSSGTLTLGGTLAVANGGTGAATLTGYVKGSGTGVMTASATIPNTDITGLGTMSTQAASSVAITGGSINGTSLGATTAGSAKVTTLDIASGLTLATLAGTSGQVLTSAGAGFVPTWTTAATGTVTSVAGTGTVNGLTLTGTVTSSGSLTLGGTLSLVSPPPIGTTTPAEVKVTVGWAANTALTDAATIAWDTVNQVATFTFVSTNRTFGAPTNLRDGAFYALAVIQNGGSNTITWNSVFKWAAGTAPTLSTAASAKDYFTFRSDGTNLYQQGISQAVA